MSHKQQWPISQDLNKRSGQCSVCFAYRQIHLSDGLIHLHGLKTILVVGRINHHHIQRSYQVQL